MNLPLLSTAVVSLVQELVRFLNDVVVGENDPAKTND